MYQRDLDGLLAKGNLPRAMLLYGESPFLITRYGRLLSDAAGAREEQKLFYFGEYSFEQCKTLLGENSLFGDKNIVVLKLDKKPPKAELDALVGLVSKNVESFLILEFYQTSGKSSTEYNSESKAMSGSFSKTGLADTVRFFPPTHAEAMAILKGRARDLGLEMEAYLLEQLLELHNGEVSLAFNELEKFTLAGSVITEETLCTLSYGLGAVRIEEMLERLLEKKPFLELMVRLLEEGANEIEILNGCSSSITQLFLFYAHIKVHGVPDSKAILGYKMPRQIEERRARSAIRFKERHYREMLAVLQEGALEIKIKTHADKEALLASTLIKLQACLG